VNYYKKDDIIMRRFSLALMMIALIACTPLMPAFAQSEVKLSNMEVDLWPEYDRPNVLVIYRITLPPTTALPVDLSFRIPAAAGEPSAVATRQTTAEGGAGLFTIPYERQVVGDWGVISLTATMPELQLEYYDPGLVKEGQARQYEYHWPGDYAVDMLKLQVQQPLGASDMSISPASGQGVSGGDGLVYYNKEVGSLTSGQTFGLTITYKKTTDDLTATNLQVQPSAPVSVTPERSDLLLVLPWALGGLGVALIVGGVVWYLQSGKGKKEDRPKRRRQPAALKEADGTGAYIYCHQCGKRASPGDVFCRMCGTKLRSE
jgi:hypothetical protein